MNKDFWKLLFGFVQTDAMGAMLTLQLVMTWDLYQKERFDLLPWFIVGALLIFLGKTFLKTEKTKEREEKLTLM